MEEQPFDLIGLIIDPITKAVITKELYVVTGMDIFYREGIAEMADDGCPIKLRSGTKPGACCQIGCTGCKKIAAKRGDVIVVEQFVKNCNLFYKQMDFSLVQIGDQRLVLRLDSIILALIDRKISLSPPKCE